MARTTTKRRDRVRQRDPEYTQVPPLPDRELRDSDRLTVAEAAAYFRVTPRVVARWIAEERLDAVPSLNGSNLVRGSDIKALLDITDDLSARKGKR